MLPSTIVGGCCMSPNTSMSRNSFQLHTQKSYAPNIKPMGPIALRVQRSGSIPYDSLPLACMYGGTVGSQLPLSIEEDRAHEAGQSVHRLAADRVCNSVRLLLWFESRFVSRSRILSKAVWMAAMDFSCEHALWPCTGRASAFTNAISRRVGCL